MKERDCPNAHPSAPHKMRQDTMGRWYCPLERDAKLEAEWNAAQAEIAMLEALYAEPVSALPGIDKENN